MKNTAHLLSLLALSVFLPLLSGCGEATCDDCLKQGDVVAPPDLDKFLVSSQKAESLTPKLSSSDTLQCVDVPVVFVNNTDRAITISSAKLESLHLVYSDGDLITYSSAFWIYRSDAYDWMETVAIGRTASLTVALCFNNQLLRYMIDPNKDGKGFCFVDSVDPSIKGEESLQFKGLIGFSGYDDYGYTFGDGGPAHLYLQGVISCQ